MIFAAHPRTQERIDAFARGCRRTCASCRRSVTSSSSRLSRRPRASSPTRAACRKRRPSLDVPCLTMRENTERPVTCESARRGSSGAPSPSRRSPSPRSPTVASRARGRSRSGTVTPAIASRRCWRDERLLNLALALPALVATAPLIAGLAAVAGQADHPGPAFFLHTRVGRDRRPFRLIKLRTMTHSSTGSDVTAAGDPRVTPLGRLLPQGEARRAAAALERRPRRDVDRRSAPRDARVGRALPRRDLRRAPRHHRRGVDHLSRRGGAARRRARSRARVPRGDLAAQDRLRARRDESWTRPRLRTIARPPSRSSAGEAPRRRRGPPSDRGAPH